MPPFSELFKWLSDPVSFKANRERVKIAMSFFMCSRSKDKNRNNCPFTIISELVQIGFGLNLSKYQEKGLNHGPPVSTRNFNPISTGICPSPFWQIAPYKPCYGQN